MKNTILLLLIFSCAVSGLAADPYMKSDYYDNGNLRSMGPVVLNEEAGGEVQHGYWQYFYPNGILESAGLYKNGLQHNEWTNWYDNGQVESFGDYSKGKKDGRWYLFYETGEKKASGKYDNDLEDGYWTFWYKNGKVETEGYYNDGKREGRRTYYDENGNKTWVGKFSDNLKVGEWVLRQKNGAIIEIYRDGVLTAARVDDYDEEGDLVAKHEYEVIMGLRTGAEITTGYGPREKIVSQGLSYNGTPCGVWRYYENGEMQQKNMGPIPQGLIERRKELNRRVSEYIAGSQEDKKSQQEFGPHKFEVVMQPPVSMGTEIVGDNGRVINLNENKYDVTRHNPTSYEALRQKTLRDKIEKATQEQRAAESQEK